MADKLKAINALRPKIKLLHTVGITEIAELISSRTGLAKSEIQMALTEYSDALKFYVRQGHGVKIPELGTYLPTIDTKGKLSISHRLDRGISKAMNAAGAFTGEIVNSQNIGKTTDEFIAMWNADHPDDPVA